MRMWMLKILEIQNKNYVLLSIVWRNFNNVKQCQQHIEQRSKKDRLILIVSDQLGHEIIPSIHNIRQVMSIYVWIWR
jgi:hypothetical protein